MLPTEGLRRSKPKVTASVNVTPVSNQSEEEKNVRDGLFMELLRQRTRLAQDGNIAPYMIVPEQTLLQLAV